MQLDDYVLCKIYTKMEHGKEDQEDIDPRTHVAPNDLDENLTTNVQVNNEQALVHNQQAHLVPNQDMNPATFHVENNVVVQHLQNFNHAIPHVENNLLVMDTNQHMNPVENSVKEVKGQIMVPEQHARVALNRDMHPNIFQVENNVIDQHSNHQDSNNATHHVENSLPTLDSNQRMNPSVENGINVLKRQDMLPDHQARVVSNQNMVNPAIFQLENNMVVQNSSRYYDRNTGSFYDFMTPNHIQMTGFRRMSAPSVNPSPLTRFNPNYSSPNRPYFPPTPRRSPPPPPRIVNAPHGPHGSHGPHGHVHPLLYQAGSNSKPPRPQVATTAAASQECNDPDWLGIFNESIGLMLSQDAPEGLLVDNFQFSFDGREQSGADESQKHEAPRVEDAKEK